MVFPSVFVAQIPEGIAANQNAAMAECLPKHVKQLNTQEKNNESAT